MNYSKKRNKAMDRVSTETQKGLVRLHSNLQKDKPRQSAVDTFRRKPFETLADCEERMWSQQIAETKKLENTLFDETNMRNEFAKG